MHTECMSLFLSLSLSLSLYIYIYIHILSSLLYASGAAAWIAGGRRSLRACSMFLCYFKQLFIYCLLLVHVYCLVVVLGAYVCYLIHITGSCYV